MRVNRILPDWRAALAVAVLVLGWVAVVQAEPPSIARAERYAAGGDYHSAAHEYSALALSAASPLREALKLRAIDALARAGDTGQARALLGRIGDLGPPEQVAAKALLAARLAQAEHDNLGVLAALAGIAPTWPAAQQRAAHEMRLAAHTALGDAVGSAHTRMALDVLLTDTAARRANRAALWTLLTDLTSSELQTLDKSANTTARGWAELATLTRASARGSDIKPALTDWLARYPQHPAADGELSQLLRRAAEPPATPPATAHSARGPRRIGVLLPLQGRYAREGNAVRLGLLAAYYAQRGSGELRFYDTADAPQNAYRRAVSEGVEWVIGPLIKNHVSTLMALREHSIPVLALNYPESTAQAPLVYSFGLAPEDEARQVAERAVLDGRTRALVLVPQGEWGARMAASFEARLTALGGVAAVITRYPAHRPDYRAQLARLIEAAPDIDFVFMAALTEQAAKLYPVLHAMNPALPVYATSHAVSGDAERDAVLDGLWVCELPGLIAGLPHASEIAPSRHERRLYALGLDAYTLVQNLLRIGDTPAAGLQGATGRLYRSADGAVHRQLHWAVIENGRLQNDAHRASSAPP